MNAETYNAWIAQYVAAQKSTLGRCRDATAKMVEAFPELRIVLGYVHDGLWGKRGHAWCVDTDGKIVDPTASQFPALLEYDPWKPGDEVLIGKCMECGSQIWEAVESFDEARHRSFCDEECEGAFRASLGV